MDIKKLLYFAAFMLLTLPIAFAQTTVVNGTIVDPSSNIWTHALITAQFVPTPGVPGPYTWSGGAYNPIPPGVFTDGSGNFSMTLPSNSAIVPSGSTWQFTVCPNATLPCAIVNIPLTGGTTNLETILNGAGAWPTGNVPATFMSKFYNPAQSGTVPLNQGAIAFNTTTTVPMYWNGAAWVNFGSGGGVLPVGPGTIQFANAGATAFVSGGQIDSDVYTTAQNAQNTACSTTVCDVMRPVNSPDTSPANILFNGAAGKISSIFFDYKGNQFGIYAANPGLINSPISSLIGGNQYLEPLGLLYSEPGPGSFQGITQGLSGKVIIYNSPGFSNGQAGCPLYCPLSPYTSTQPWTTFNTYLDFMSFNGAGIKQSRNDVLGFYGIGDSMGGTGASFITYAGGAVAPSDEGLHALGEIHSYTAGDAGGTLTTIVDANHIVANFTVNASTQGQGRFVLDDTSIPQDTVSHQPLTLVPADSQVAPTGTTYGTIATGSVNLPVSYATGKLTNNCTVPTQFGGVAIGQNSLVNGCDVTVLTGTFDTVAPVCMAASSANNFDIGIKLSAVTALSGGHQTLTGTMHRSVPAGGFVFQGGMCGTAMILGGDQRSDVNQNGTLVLGSVFPLIGSVDAHTVAYMNYFGSQVWAPIPNAGSQWGTRATDNSPAAIGMTASLVRTGGTVTATIGNRFQQNPPGFLKLENVKFISVVGCSDTTFNTPGLNAFVSMPGPAANIAVYPQAGPDSVCPSAIINLQNTFVNFEWVAEIYDVENHITGLADGTMAISWQPNFQLTDVMDVPPHYQAVSDILNLQSEFGQPQSFNSGLSITMRNYSAIEGPAIQVTMAPANNVVIGQGGSGIPSEVMDVLGSYGTGMFFHTTPTPTRPLIAVGFPNAFGGTASIFRNWNLWALDVINANTVGSTFNFDEDTQTYNLRFQGTTNAITYAPKFSQFFNPTITYDTKFAVVNSVGNLTHITQCSPIVPDTIVAPCYANVIPTTAVITQSGTAGSTRYDYMLLVNDTTGPSWSGLYSTFTGNATLSGTNFNIIPCTDLPTGKTGEIYILINPGMETVGPCSSSAGTVHDTGVYGPFNNHNPLIDGTYFYSGGFAATGTTGSFSFTQPDIFGNSSLPTTITAGISQLSAGNLSIDSTTIGNSGGNLQLHNINILGTCTVGGVSCGTSTSGTVTTFSAGNLAPLFTTSVSNPTTTPALSFTINPLANFISVANITLTMPTSSIPANTCTTPVANTMTGVTTASTFTASFATSPVAANGWGNVGGLVFAPWPTANTINWSVCNQTTSPIVPGAIALNVGAR